MKKQLPVQFRCYAEYDHDAKQWIAACIDLCLAAQADTLDGARKGLHAQVADYIQDALEMPSIDQTIQMLNRKAPVSELIHYYVIKYKIALGIGQSEQKRPERFKEVPKFTCAAA